MKAALQTETPPVAPARAQTVPYVVPDVNIYETKDGYELEAEMPGVNKDGLEITLEGNEITITGHRASEAAVGDVLFRERHAPVTVASSTSTRRLTARAFRRA